MHPSLLKSIHADLIDKNRIEDAKRLYATYDTASGYLKSLGKTDYPYKNALQNEVIDSSKMPYPILEQSSKLKGQWEMGRIYGYAYCQDNVQAILGFQSDYSKYGGQFSVPSSYVGTTGQNKRLFQMMIQADLSLNPSTLPDIHYSLNNWSNGVNLGWTGNATWGQWTGTINVATCNIKMWFGSNFPNYHIWYCAHNEGTGWSRGWVHDGAVTGRDGWRMEAYAFMILQY